MERQYLIFVVMIFVPRRVAHAHTLDTQAILTRAGAAAAAIQTFEHLDFCCVLPADAQTADKDLFEFKPVADGVYAAIAAPRYKVNSNAAVILTNDGVVVVDSTQAVGGAGAVQGDPGGDQAAHPQGH